MYICHYRRHTVGARLTRNLAGFASFNRDACKRLLQSEFLPADLYRFPMQWSYNAVDSFRNEETRGAEDEQPSRNYRI